MNFSEIKDGFVLWLQDKQKASGGEAALEEYENINIFSHFSDFKEYLFTTNLADSSIFTKSFSDLQSMQIVGGKFVEASDDNANQDDVIISGILNEIFSDEEVVGALDEDGSEDLDMDEIGNFIAPYLEGEGGEATLNLDDLREPIACIYLLDDIYEDKDALSFLDEDKDGELSDFEKAKFQAYAQGNNDTLKLSQLQNLYASIKDGTFPSEDYAKFEFEFEEETPEPAAQEVQEEAQKAQEEAQKAQEEAQKAQEASATTPEASSAQQTGGTGSVGGSYGGSSSTGGTGNIDTNAAKKEVSTDPLDNYDLSGLESLKTQKQSELNTSHQELQDVYSGKDEEVRKREETLQDKKDAYLELLKNDENIDPETREQELQTIEDISTTKKNIGTFKSTLDSMTQLITTQKAAIAIDDCKIGALKAALAALPAKGGEGYPEDESGSKAQDIEAKRAQIEQQLTLMQEKREQDEKPLLTANSEGRTPEEEIAYINIELPKAETKLEQLEKKKDILENGDGTDENQGILVKCSEETKAALKDYNDAQKALDTYKQNRIENINSAIDIQQKEINKIDDKIKEVAPKEIEKQYKVNAGTFTDSPTESTLVTRYSQFENADGYEYNSNIDMDYLLIAPEDADPNEELPVLVFLHGLGEVGGQLSRLTSAVHGPGGFMTEETGWDLSNFNGYIICPHLEGGSWGSDAYNKVCGILDDFNSTHKTGKTVVMGASLGGSGTVNFANSDINNGYFDEAVVISGYTNNIRNIQIPISGYVGVNDDGTSINIMKNTFGSNLVTVDVTDSTGSRTNHAHVPRDLLSLDADGDGNSDILQKLFGQDD